MYLYIDLYKVYTLEIAFLRFRSIMIVDMQPKRASI